LTYLFTQRTQRIMNYRLFNLVIIILMRLFAIFFPLQSLCEIVTADCQVIYRIACIRG